MYIYIYMFFLGFQVETSLYESSWLAEVSRPPDGCNVGARSHGILPVGMTCGTCGEGWGRAYLCSYVDGSYGVCIHIYIYTYIKYVYIYIYIW